MTNEELHRMFVYEETGLLRRVGGRKEYPWRPIGVNGRYLATTVSGVTYYLHRLVWQYHHGFVPTMIDHINGKFSDNRIENLRECTNAQNQYNSPRKANNKSGFKGVAYCPMYRRPWRARIVSDGKVILLGYFKTKEEAAAAYATHAPSIAGDFARVG